MQRVAHAQIQRQIRAHFPVVLNESSRASPAITIRNDGSGEQIVVDCALQKTRPDDSAVAGGPTVAGGLVVAETITPSGGEVVLESV